MKKKARAANAEAKPVKKAKGQGGVTVKAKAKVQSRGAGAFKPVKLKGEQVDGVEREEGGPLRWLLPTMEAAYARIVPRGAVGPFLGAGAAAGPAAPAVSLASSSLQLAGMAALEPAGPSVWRDLFLQYKRRKSTALGPSAGPSPAGAAAAPTGPLVPGSRNWLPLGPNIVLQGQTVGEHPVAGRIAGLAVAPGANVIYAASANGGVFRSIDGAATWQSMMDGFDLNPTNFASASLVCGAIALDPANPNRVYVGTGEGDTLQLFRSRITGALPGYRGVGPIRTDNGGATWISERSTPELAGEAFFALAVDPGDRENVVGATTQGLYRRVSRPGGLFEWVRVQTGVHSSVVVARGGGTTRFYCARWGQGGAPSELSQSGVFHSDDGGATWTPSGTGFPVAGIGRIALGVRATDPNLLYALVAGETGALGGVFRLDGVAEAWKPISMVPDVLPGAQGSYDLTIAVDPSDANLIYLGGDRMDSAPFSGSIWRCVIQATATGFEVKDSASIGTHAHSDVHIVVHTPGDPNELWCGCDGGVFLNRNPRATGEFAAQNNGLSCLCSNFLGQHPTDPNVLFSGLQDNGTAHTADGPIWTHVSGGDGGYCLVNWTNPDLVLVFANGTVLRSVTGGSSHGAWANSWNFPWATMTQPIVSPPFNPNQPADADVVAVGAGQFVFISEDFAGSWPMSFMIPGGNDAGQIFALTFASPTRLFLGTTRGLVFQADRQGNDWLLVRLDDVAAGPIGLDVLITDIAIDWADTTHSSVYISLGGMGDQRRVWWFDGTKWEVRAGAVGVTNLLDVEHNAIVVDREAPNNVYVGADIGVWHSPDGGRNWAPMENGLPDAPVFDLQIHPTQRLLRAATHGRGLFEIPLD